MNYVNQMQGLGEEKFLESSFGRTLVSASLVGLGAHYISKSSGSFNNALMAAVLILTGYAVAVKEPVTFFGKPVA